MRPTAVVAQANIMARSSVPDAMVDAYRGAEGDLGGRLLAALEAAEREGGDLRGRQSAALVVTAAKPDTAAGRRPADRPARGRSPRSGGGAAPPAGPACRLRPRGGRRRARRRGRRPGRLEQYAAAHERAPGNAELAFWHGVALAANGREDDARVQLERAYRDSDGWRELLRRLPAAGLFPDDAELVARMT